jgi:hypothetical protein
VEEISVIGRNTQGVTLFRIDPSQEKVVAVAPLAEGRGGEAGEDIGEDAVGEAGVENNAGPPAGGDEGQPRLDGPDTPPAAPTADDND